MCNWFLIVLKILSFLEDLRVDELLQRVFKNPDLSIYFGRSKEISPIQKQKSERGNSGLLSPSFKPSSNSGQVDESFLRDKRSRLQSFMEKEQGDWNIKNVFILSELLLLDNLELKGKIVDLIYRQFSCGRRYFETINATITIDAYN